MKRISLFWGLITIGKEEPRDFTAIVAPLKSLKKELTAHEELKRAEANAHQQTIAVIAQQSAQATTEADKAKAARENLAVLVGE